MGDAGRFDSYAGEGINGSLVRLKDELRAARRRGPTLAVLILDAGYQFCVNIGVYVDRWLRPRPAA